MLLWGPRGNLDGYLEAVDILKGVVGFFSSKENFKGVKIFLHQANNLLSKAFLIIEGEFKQLLRTYSKPVEPDSLFVSPPKLQLASKGDSEIGGGNRSQSEHPSKSLETAIYRTPTLIPPEILQLLHRIAQQLVQAGNQQSCYNIYRDARSSALELSLQKLGVQHVSTDDVERMQWLALEAKTGDWTQFMRIAVKHLLAGERKICDQVFDCISFNKDQCFAELARTGVLTLLSFGDAVAKSKSFPQKSFLLLEMYEVMYELRSEVEVIFQGKFCSEMLEATLGLMKRLAQTAQESFLDYKEVVESDTSNTNVQDGTVHTLTYNVINYVNFLFDYQSALKLVFQEYGTGGDTESQLAVILESIMEALQNNLDGKSKLYKDPALMYIFLMNNIHYMVKSVRRSEAKDILGDDWIQRHRRIVLQNANHYKRVTWTNVVQTLSVPVPGVSSPGSSAPSDLSNIGVSRTIVKERLKSFNMQFDELRAKQYRWTIPDPQLQETLRLAVAEVLLPAYRSFINRFGNLIEQVKNPRKYLKYSPEQLEQLLGEFFGGQQLGERKQ
ncbi:hypothetical protein BRADI_4g41980v3 [Brachypodium distachyon]|uniref:Exocyst subunit Exo70 family protein n=2 Tax=Brachypodium distachyon TaxID=15368 RepID=A0A2K2CTP7_BRADI|nr:hypothetical protein BRADI_4g41980v3 [Brachypodium distachyon]PNT65405.1 hypothetical protein BRADI_4g41980v3 [Brachypodium distachyon]